jgi:peptidoglycan/xylan/chitin deacetylase (PgdA/CDA1 family)
MPLGWGLERIARLSSRRMGIALVYHRVGDPPGELDRELVPSLGASLFAAQVQHLKRRYCLVAASDLRRAIDRRQRGEPFPLAITFDDDLRSHIEVAGPILAAAGATATFFLCGASLEAPKRFWWERLQVAFDRRLDLTFIAADATGIHALGRAVELMSADARDAVATRLLELVGHDPPDAGLRSAEARMLADRGFEIGFHTQRHDPLPALGNDELQHALSEGRHELERATQTVARAISYPHGRADARVAEAAREAGFEIGFTGHSEVVTADTSPLLLGRISPSYDSVGELALRIAAALVLPRARR